MRRLYKIRKIKSPRLSTPVVDPTNRDYRCRHMCSCRDLSTPYGSSDNRECFCTGRFCQKGECCEECCSLSPQPQAKTSKSPSTNFSSTNLSRGYLNSSGANVMMCHGQYVVNDPCYPMCSRQDGNGCEQPWGGNQSGGPTQQYSITQGDGRGDSFTRHVVSPIDPYQSIIPEDLGGTSSFRGYNSSGPGGTGDTVITVGGDTYSYDPVLSYDMGCNIMDEMGDGIEPNKNCDNRGIAEYLA